MKQLGIYIHTPFCVKRCNYCNFFSNTNLNLIDLFIKSLCFEIANFNLFNLDKYEVNSIYFGGGTPNLIKLKELDKILNVIYSKFKVSSNTECSIELNPNLVSYNYLAGLQSLKFNRLSIGVQSAVDSELKILGRLHNFKQAREAVLLAQRAGFSNLSTDLMVATPSQTESSLMESLVKLTELNVMHISAYQLKIEKGTPFFNKYDEKSADEVAKFYEIVVNFLRYKNFKNYEISNFAKVGFECVHNLKYWNMEPYLGFGPSSHSYFEGKRFSCESNLELYLKCKFKRVFDFDRFDINLEWLMLRSRLQEPISFTQLAEHGYLNDRFKDRLIKLEKQGLVTIFDKSFKLTSKGFLVQNSILIYLTE